MKTDRLVSIIMLLLERKRVSAQELAEQFEVSPRTIYRDIDAINLAGVPVRATSGVGGGFEILQKYKLDQSVFSAADLSAILMGLSNLSGVMGGAELGNALAKVRRFIPAERAQDIALKSSQIHIDLSPWVGNQRIPAHLEILKTALQENQLVCFAYAAHRGNETVRTVEPYQLVLKNSQWYLQGYCLTRQDYRLFKLSRMSGLQLREEHFAPREYERPQLDFGDLPQPVLENIKLRIHRSVMDRVLDLCAFEHFTPDGAEHYLVDFPFLENEYNYDMLLSFGDKCECLAPPHVRAGMKCRIERLARLYP